MTRAEKVYSFRLKPDIIRRWKSEHVAAWRERIEARLDRIERYLRKRQARPTCTVRNLPTGPLGEGQIDSLARWILAEMRAQGAS